METISRFLYAISLSVFPTIHHRICRCRLMPFDRYSTPSSTVQIGHRTAHMVRRCKKYFYKSSAYLQSRVPQCDSGFSCQLLLQKYGWYCCSHWFNKADFGERAKVGWILLVNSLIKFLVNSFLIDEAFDWSIQS